MARPSGHHLHKAHACLSVHSGGGRFLKTVLCVHDEGGLVVVKVEF
jgi:hypothetical protein